MDLVNKYRPTKLAQVIGQDAAVATLRGVMKRRGEINPVTLFCGPHSTGKTTLAWLLALYANCKKPQDGEACRKCSSCRNIIRAIQHGIDGRSVIEKPVADRGIDAIRALESQARYKCQDRYKWYVLDEVHNLTKPAFDAALRLFEKPPRQARFILCTTAPEALPATIRSRNFVFSLQTIAPEVTAKKLLLPVCKREKFKVEKKTLKMIAEKVHGHPRDALNLLAQWVAATDGGAKPEDAPRIIRGLDAAAQYEIVERYCKAILHGKTLVGIYALQSVTAHEYFIGQVLELLRQVMYRWVSNDKVQLGDGRWDRAVAEVAPLPVPKKLKAFLLAMGEVLQVYLDAQDRIKQYRCDNQAVLEAATIEVASLVGTWRNA